MPTPHAIKIVPPQSCSVPLVVLFATRPVGILLRAERLRHATEAPALSVGSKPWAGFAAGTG